MNREPQAQAVTNTALAKGAACLPCRKQRIRCDGLKPQCSRCQRLAKHCAYSSRVQPHNSRNTLTNLLEARILELELLTHKLTLSSAHSLFLASKKLHERIHRLGNIRKSKQMLGTTSQAEQRSTAASQSRQYSSKDTSIGPLTPRDAIERELRSIQLEDFQDLPLSLSIALVDLFIPSRLLWHFLADVTRFLNCVSLPPSHPESIHPCLLNACYLGACTNARNGLIAFQPIFLQRTRHFLQQSLMFADRHIHFLWANVILGVFLARERRITECMALAGANDRFAIACGLNLLTNPMKEGNASCQSEDLLPPPKDKVEADDRLRLAYTIFDLGHALRSVCGYSPAFTYDVDDDEWSLPLDGTHPENKADEDTVNEEEAWRFELRLKGLVLKTFGRVQSYARFAAEHKHRGLEGEYLALEEEIYVKPVSAFLFFEKSGLESVEASSTVNQHVIFAHSVLYGSGLILHSLRAHDDPEAKRKLLQCAKALVDVCDNARGSRRLHVSVVGAVQMMNTVRVLSRELQRAEAQDTTELLISYCRAIELLLDYLDELILFLPAWADAPVALKSTLLAATASLPN